MTVNRYKLIPLGDSHQWRLMVLRSRKGGGQRGGAHYVCIAIGTGKKNMLALRKALA